MVIIKFLSMQLIPSYNVVLRCVCSAETYRKYAEFDNNPHGAKDLKPVVYYAERPACGFNRDEVWRILDPDNQCRLIYKLLVH